MNKTIKESRKKWIKNLKTQITHLRLFDKNEKEIKKEFVQHCTFIECRLAYFKATPIPLGKSLFNTFKEMID